MRSLRRVVLAVPLVLCAVVGVLAGVLLGARPAAAQSGESIRDYDVAVTLEADGTMRVDEVIEYDFGPNERRGIFRDLVIRESYTTSYDRVYRISDIRVRTGPDTPGDVSVSDEGNFRRVRIGDPNTYIRGVHRYEISYVVEGGPRTFPDHDELYWDAVGNLWAVPIDAVSVTVTTPAAVDRVACFSGPQGANLPCDTSSSEGNVATFTATGLGTSESVTVVVGMPLGTFRPPAEPILERRWTPSYGFQATPAKGGLAGLAALLGIGGVSLAAWRKGRDRAFVGSAVDQALGNTTGAEQRRRAGRLQVGTVEFVPPDGIRPGQLGTLIDERANLLDVTSTIIDLAVRGWLRIVEVPKEGGWRSKADYELQRPNQPGKGTLHGYEQLILDSLFAGRSTVRLSDLKYTWCPELAAIQNALYDDLVAQGWYRSRPDRTRNKWRVLGVLATIAGGVVGVVLVANGWGLLGLSLFLTGVTLTVLAGRMPARTAKGTAMLTRVLGFRRLFTEGLEDARSRFAEEKGIFSEYLPFAIVFGCTGKWAETFEALGLGPDQLGTTGWYSGPDGFTALAVAHAMDDFDTAAVGTMYASQPSSSSSSGFSGGFSGGGGGGGGGGSW